MHMKKATNITLATLAAALLASSCIKEADPYEIATEDQVTLETLIEGIPASLVQAGSAGYAKDGQAWDFALPAIHIATESMTGDVAIGGNIGYDWFAQWGTNEALGADYAVGALTWDNYYAWIMAANNVIKQIDASDFATLDATQKSYLGFAYAYRAMFYLDLVRLYEFKENNYTEAPGVLGLGVPIVLPETTEAEAKNNPRAKVDDIYDQVIFPDLDKAEELLSGFTAPDKYTISPALVYGLKARAWLERGTAKNDAEAYVSAAEYARLAINASGCTPLTQEQWEDPSNGFNSAMSNNAWIWGLALPSESVANLFCFTAHMSTENAWSAYGNDACRCINSNLYNSIDLRDFRRHSWLDPDRKDPEKESYDYKSCRKEGKEYFNELPDYANIKFRPAQGAYEDFKVGGAADHPYMRVEEMYFIEAEAKAHENLGEGIRLRGGRRRHGARHSVQRILRPQDRQIYVQKIGRLRARRRRNGRLHLAAESQIPDLVGRGRLRGIRLGGLEEAHRGARRHDAARGRRPVRHKSGIPQKGHKAWGSQRDSGESQPNRDAHRDV